MALLSLLRELPFESIEIQTITDRANTARVTFYRHYGTKEELLLDVLEGIYQDLREKFFVHSIEPIFDFSQMPPVTPLFIFLAQDRLLYKKLLMGSASALIQLRVRRYFVELIGSTLKAAPQYADLPITLIANQVASTMIGNIMWWLCDELAYTAEEMARLSHVMAWSGAMALVGLSDNIIPAR
jgi:AcrR family transcriptional regulator